MDSRKVNLVKNATLLAVGNMSSRLLSFILLPVFAFYLKPSDYGEIDIYITVLTILCIVVSLQSIEASFRFIQDCSTDQERTITLSNSLAISIAGIGIFSLGMLIAGYASNFRYSALFILYVATSIIANLFLHSARGMKKMLAYTVISIASTIMQVLCNIIFIAGMGMGAVALLWTPIISNALVAAILVIKVNIPRYCKPGAVRIRHIKEQLKYSLPLIPNAICVWLLSALGRFILLLYYGTSEVGLLVFTLKFPLLLETVNNIFMMAWQMSVISEYKASDRDVFASEVFHQFSRLLLSAMLVILPLVKVAIFTIMGKDYAGTWVFIPVFFFGVVFNSYAQFYSMGFFSVKKTNEVFYSAFVSLAVYAAVGLLSAKPLHIFGVGMAYSAAGLINWLFVKKRVEAYIKIRINVRQQMLFLALISGFTAVYYTAGLWVQAGMALAGVCIAIFKNRVLIRRLLTPLGDGLIKATRRMRSACFDSKTTGVG